MTVIVERVAVVRGEHHHGVVQDSALFEGVEDPTDLLVDEGDVGEVVPPLAVQLLRRGVLELDDRIVVVGLVMRAQLLQRRGLRVQIGLRPLRLWHRPVAVGLEVAGRRIVRRVRPGESDLEEERVVVLGVRLEPVAGEVADEVVGMEILRELPFEGAEAFCVVVALSVRDAAGLLMAADPDRLVPLVEEVRQIGMGAILVLDDVPFVEAHRCLVGVGVHLAHARAPVSGGGEVLHPGVAPRIIVPQDA